MKVILIDFVYFQEANETLPKRKRKPLTRFSPDFFAKQTDQTKSQPLEKDCNQTKPTVCESCFVLFKRTSLLSKKECRRRFFDPIANKRLLLCNACGVRMARVVSGRPKKHVFKVIFEFHILIYIKKYIFNYLLLIIYLIYSCIQSLVIT